MPLPKWAWLHPPAKESFKVSLIWRLTSSLLIATIGLFAKMWLMCFNKTTVYNRDILQDLVDHRDRGLLTVSNHHSPVDDPGIWGVLRADTFFKTGRIRYTAADADVSFFSKITSTFMSLGKVFPVQRGDGVYQKGMDFMIEHLDLGNWCHIFPDGYFHLTHDFYPLQWGVGRVVAECQTTPIILPIWHCGMDSILPVKPPFFPIRVGKKVTILIGKPMDLTSEVTSLKEKHKTPIEMRKHITDLIQEELRILKKKADALHYQR